MQRNVLIGIIIAVILIVGVGAYVLTSNTSPSVAASETSTKFALYNTGPTWAALDLTMVNVTMKDGTQKDLHAQVFLKPVNGQVVIDLSELLGYGTDRLPAGTSIRILSWKGLVNETVPGSNQDLNLDFQGWSNTLNPQTSDQKYNVFFADLPVYQLPSGITDDTIKWGTVEEIADLNLDSTEPVFEEEILTVNEDGTVSIVFTQPPTLCTVIAHIF
ncbi:hypothetical protein [Methanobacterium alcaliphilum]|uniref:hypothetical protein n=1 Tax=Methanobacterium alcaliphilum TaxID=392018 RepID=UPI00200B1247|nr:hypothetical protein [Methanobacterium alcaliphilum]MCK9152011.1 hypothetical protein [Methanobacterium alcaliphilum]